MTLHTSTHSVSHSRQPSSLQGLRKAGANPPAPAANLAVMS